MAVIFWKQSDGSMRIDDIYVFPPDYDVWISREIGRPLKAPSWFTHSLSLRSKAKDIASQTHDYDLLAKQVREFQDLSSQCGLSGNAVVSNFVASANDLIGFGASWRDTANATHSDYSSNVRKEIESSITLALNASGGSLGVEAKAKLTAELSEKLSKSTENTIHRLDDNAATKFTALEYRLSDAYREILNLTSPYACLADK